MLFDENGNGIKSSTIEYPLYQLNNGWAEQDPEDWWNATKDGIKFVVNESGINSKGIKGIGLSGQMHGLVMLDKNCEILRKAYV